MREFYLDDVIRYSSDCSELPLVPIAPEEFDFASLMTRNYLYLYGDKRGVKIRSALRGINMMMRRHRKDAIPMNLEEFGDILNYLLRIGAIELGKND